VVDNQKAELLWHAMTEYGLEEIPGPKHNERIVGFSRELGLSFDDDETSWCGIFLAVMCKRAGIAYADRGYSARAWLKWGQEVKPLEVETGDIVVYWRVSPSSWQGHVGIYIAESTSGKKIHTLGGNQNNSVSIQPYFADHVLGFRKI